MRAGAERERIGAGPPSLALRAFYRYPLETTWIAKRGAR